MRTPRAFRSMVAALAVAALAGCASHRPKRTVVSEPPLIGDASGVAEDAPMIVEAPEARPVTIADRHPILTRPREYYDTTGGSKVAKTAAAAVIGVPSGIGAEIKQIIVGRPVTP